ncbi:S41 family peptidase [Stenotrophomonas sp. W1S232]|uniref:S41 family peptidase n=1 Tax=Stenotrophomonas koreensis TaxID=266128 RepID=A0A7W3V1Z4_9GAMM|nr:S41 family peptidase [Stenotrophomonas koreensis]MBB1118028.1 S41 family peptidase [Stenotrophomonas koreensis]
MRLDHRILVSCLLLAGISPAFAQQTAVPDPVVVSQQVPLDEIRRYVTVFNAVRAAYVEPVADAQLMQSAIRGLLLELDPHSSYLDAEQAQLFEEQSRGAYEGIGVEVQTLKDKVLRVIAPIDGSPAALAGIQPGDLIIAVEGKPMAAITDPEPLRGPAGSSVTLSVRREGQSKPLEIVVQRQTIRLSSVRSRMLEPGYGYIRISTFQADTATDFAQHARALAAQAESQPLHGLVLDLRSNPGGLLTAAVQVADELLEQGTIVSTRGRLSSSDSQFEATPGQLLENTAVMVLVDAGSASASEVLAAALADNQRAKVIGSRTFGKGSVQSVLPLDNGDSIKLTTARYYTPSGRSIQAVGIAPDIVLKPEGEPIAAGEYREAGLAGHLLGEEELAQVQSGDFLPGDEPVQQALAALKSSVPGTDGE